MNTSAQADNKQHIVIVGGGMVGISLALMLSQALSPLSADITLIERYPLQSQSTIAQPSFDDRSTALSSGTAEILKKMACWPSLEYKAEKISCVHVSDKGHFGGTQLEADSYGMDALGYVLENKYLGQAFISLLQKSRVKCLAPALVSHCVAKKSGYELHIQEPEKSLSQNYSMFADLVLIADGADSPLRSALGISVETKDYKQSALIANVALAEHHQGIAYERFTDEGPIALLPLSTLDNVHRAALVWTLPEEKSKRIAAMPREEMLKLLQERFGFRAGKISAMGESHLYSLQLIKAQEQVRSHLVVVGNAAHFLHPVAGQGFNLALRDCWSLSECLQRAEKEKASFGDYSTLKHYLKKQAYDQDLTIGLTDNLVKLFSSTQLSKAVLRQLGLISLNVSPYARKQFAQKMMGLTIPL